ncbi:DUF1289 domain-containing protein [Roseibium sp. SCPC15]|jgi:hypothetical protein
MKSPCINICQIDQESGLCTGCLRSLDEIAGWASYSDDERAEVLSDLDRRRENGSPKGER